MVAASGVGVISVPVGVSVLSVFSGVPGAVAGTSVPAGPGVPGAVGGLVTSRFAALGASLNPDSSALLFPLLPMTASTRQRIRKRCRQPLTSSLRRPMS